MDISFISPAAYSGTAANSQSKTEKTAAPTAGQADNPAYRVSISAKVQVLDIEAAYSAPAAGSGRVQENSELQDESAAERRVLLTTTKSEIRDQVQARAVALLDSYLTDNPEVRTTLGDFFTENPEAAEEISRGEIPEYFNVDNTAKRILDIYFQRYDGGDKAEFAERAKGIINQAYAEVDDEVGGLPSIVNQTKDKILDVLDRFAAGEDVSEFASIPDISAETEPEKLA